ncbi:hypothetical protein V8G54_037779 [Vigna mungo]|uniref:Uncharacterized protein n=1 Tax=Vigna mungo TaxID=3915 RepID=A0AAQ3MJY6_VIGMU
MGLRYSRLELIRCRPFTCESHTHHLVYLPSKLCWIIRRKTTGNQSCIIQKIDSSEGIFIIGIRFVCSIQIPDNGMVRVDLKHPSAPHEFQAGCITHTLCLHQPFHVCRPTKFPRHQNTR